MNNIITMSDSAAMSVALDMLDPPAALESKKIPRLLLVDDEPRLLSSLCELLKDLDCQLVTATCGKEAIEKLNDFQFDIVLLDLRLPDMSGHEIMEFMIAQEMDASIIVLSGNTDIDSAIGALKRGAYSYLRKPFPRDELLKAVDNALHKRKLEGENRNISSRLECSEKLYRYLIDSSPDILYTLNSEGRFTFVNDRVQQLLGFRRNELVGKHYSVLVHEEDLGRAQYVFVERRGGDRASRNVELRLRNRNADSKQCAFDDTLKTISFNSMGIYAHDQATREMNYFGTYVIGRDISDRKRAEMLISYQAYHDILTGLPNRALFRDRFELALIQAKRNQRQLVVMFVDLDRFKLVNDTLGHIKGDELLQQVAARLKGSLRGGDTLARLGGDEFTVLLPDLREKQDATVVAEKFLECLQDSFHLDGHNLHVTASIGIAGFPSDGETIDDLIRHADIAMYQVKELGKNGYGFYDSSMLDLSHQKIALEQSLRKALEHDELEMYYQPQIDVATGRTVAAEALMRWNHPERGLLSAGEFLPFAEENGLMIPISEWMIETVCRDLAKWNLSSSEPVRLAFNLSPQCLDRGDFFSHLQDTLRIYGIPPSQVEVEITENICIRNPQHAIEQLHKLCQLGVKVAIDDFGTGYSSLAYLHRFPVHTIKIDKSFVSEIQQESGHFPVVLAIISIARGLGLEVIAEGVETTSQVRYLEHAGCNIMQGYLFHKPLPQNQLMRCIESDSALTAVAGT